MNQHIVIKLKHQIRCFTIEGNYIIILVFISIILSQFTSCRQLIQDDLLDYESTPTINSILVEGKPLSVLVSLTSELDSLQLPTINNAIIDLYVNEEFSEQLKYTEDGIYNSKTIIEPEKKYKCQVKIPNQDTIVCNQTLPTPNPILKVEHINIAGRDEEGTTFPAIKITFINDPDIQLYFEVAIKCFYSFQNKLEQRSAWLQTITDPVLLNEGLPIALFCNELMDRPTYTMTLNYATGSSRTYGGSVFRTTLVPLIIELRSVTYEYYRYKKQYYLYQKGISADGLLSPATAFPLFSNIENANGIFAGYSVFATDTITPEPYEE